MNVTPTPSTQPKEKQVFTCTTCTNKFPSHFAYNKHLAKCKNSANTCFVCDCKFDSPEEVREHQKSQITHKGKFFLCEKDDCLFSSMTKKGLTYHIEATHSGSKGPKYTCDACDEVFTDRDTLSDHKKSPEHKQKTKTTPCPGNCGRMFSGNFEAKRHYKNSCCFNKERSVKCTVCNIKTGAAKDFLSHLQKEHASANKYLCTRCLLDMPNVQVLNQHQKKCMVRKD